MDYFTADTHFGHANILKHCNRPFANVHEMDETLLRNINRVVKPDDRLFHLGDFARNNIESYRKKINCRRIYLIRGNHEYSSIFDEKLFTYVTDLYYYKGNIDGDSIEIALCHYAMRTWHKSHYGSWHLYGHSHGQLADDPNSLSFDVGVDCHNFTPLNLEQIQDIMIRKLKLPKNNT